VVVVNNVHQLIMVTSSHDNTNINLVTAPSSSSCDYTFTPNLLTPTISFQSPPKMVWQPSPSVPLDFITVIHSPKYPFNCTNQISVVHTIATAMQWYPGNIYSICCQLSTAITSNCVIFIISFSVTIATY